MDEFDPTADILHRAGAAAALFSLSLSLNLLNQSTDDQSENILEIPLKSFKNNQSIKNQFLKCF